MPVRRFYQHRVNTLEQLRNLPTDVGLEFDLRSDGQDVLVTHDPFTRGPTIEEFFPLIGPRPCIFNVKCEGIEQRVIDLAQQHGIVDFFLLDVSVPAAWKLTQREEKRFAVRWSEMEPLENVLAWQNRARWVWIDCFTHFPGTLAEWQQLASLFQLCVVSPELQGHLPQKFAELQDFLRDRPFHAVCSKNRIQWENS